MNIVDVYIRKRNLMSRKTAHYARQWLAILLTLSFTVSVAIDGNNAPAQSRRKPTRKSTAQAKQHPSEPQLRSFMFETVTVDSKGAITSRRKGQARYYIENLNGVRLEMVEIPGGSFTMGSPNSDHEREGPPHTVSVPAFYIGKYEVTLEQWREVAKLPKINRDLLSPDIPRTKSDVAEPSFFKGSDKLPVHKVFWGEAVEFCERLSRATGRTYRLPSEAEWEYACRAGTTTPFAFGETITAELVNYRAINPFGSSPKGAYRERPTPVGSLGAANRFGLYDMHGNVREWCLDNWHEVYNNAPADGSAWIRGGDTLSRVIRGGSWGDDGYYIRSAYRSKLPPGYLGGGFRVVAVARTRTR